VRHDPFSPGNGASFYDYLLTQRPELLPQASTGPVDLAIPHGTTVLAAVFDRGVVIAGDRMASDGHSVSSRRIDKVVQTDAHSALAISGAVGPCFEMAKLFTTELEYYEKIEGRQLSLSGKANKLGMMVRGNLNLAMQGLAVIPLFAGFDAGQKQGRVFKYDVAGGQTEEPDFVTTGSGSVHCKGALKRAYRPDMDRDSVVSMAISALFDASEDDLATAGPDMLRGIYPTVMVIAADGVTRVTDDEVKAISAKLTGGEGSTS